MTILVASFDEVPSFKGASTHILAGLRTAIRTREVLLVTLGDTALPAAPGFRHLPVPIRERNLLRRATAFRAAVRRIIRAERPTVVHARSPWEGLPALEQGIPLLFEVNGLASIELPYRFRSIPASVIEKLAAEEARCLDHARAVIVPSLLLRDLLIARGCRAPIRWLPNGVDPVPVRAAPYRPPSPGEPLRLIYLGTLAPWQGIVWSLRAIRGIADGVHLDIYTPTRGPLRAYLERRIRRYGLGGTVRVREPVGRAELSAALYGAHLGFAPFLKTERNTDQGGFPLKLLDFRTHALPILAPDLRLVRQAADERTAALYHPNSVRSLTARLEELARRPELLAAMHERSAADTATSWSWERYGEELDDLYEGLSPGAATASDGASEGGEYRRLGRDTAA